MKVERRLIGVLIISLIVGTLISMYMIREKIETPVSLIDESYPRRALSGTSDLDQDKYSVAFICREDLTEVAVHFASLIEVEPIFSGSTGKVQDLEKAGEQVAQISNQLSLLRKAGYEPQVLVTQVEIDGRRETAVVYDFSSQLSAVLPPVGSSHYRSIYVLLVNKSKMIDRLFEGVPDFFFMKDFSLQSLEITLNANKTVYMKAKEKGQREEGTLPISQVRAYGTVLFRNLKRNDRVSIVYRIMSRHEQYPVLFRKQLSKSRYVIHMVKFQIDGELAEDKLQVHVMDNGGYQEET